MQISVPLCYFPCLSSKHSTLFSQSTHFPLHEGPQLPYRPVRILVTIHYYTTIPNIISFIVQFLFSEIWGEIWFTSVYTGCST